MSVDHFKTKFKKNMWHCVYVYQANQNPGLITEPHGLIEQPKIATTFSHFSARFWCTLRLLPVSKPIAGLHHEFTTQLQIPGSSHIVSSAVPSKYTVSANILIITDTSIKRAISGQSTPMVKSCIWTYAWYGRFCLLLSKSIDRLLIFFRNLSR